MYTHALLTVEVSCCALGHQAMMMTTYDLCKAKPAVVLGKGWDKQLESFKTTRIDPSRYCNQILWTEVQRVMTSAA